MRIVQDDLPLTAERSSAYIRELVKTYPFFRSELLGRTAFGRPIRTLVLGTGPRRVLFTAAHHANEWITGLILLRFAEEMGRAFREDGSVAGYPARELMGQVTVYMVPMVDPDGADLVTGALTRAMPGYSLAAQIARAYPQVPFPGGWKANLLGTDLNLNYPAGWEQARAIKFQKGYRTPAPRDYVGMAPLDQIETRLLAGYTRFLDPALVLAFHSQGREIYWQFGEKPVPGAQALGQAMARASGYTLSQTAYESGFAGYKDWFIQEFFRPGYTVEVGRGQNPLPLSQFPEIYRDNRGLLVTAALGRAYGEELPKNPREDLDMPGENRI